MNSFAERVGNLQENRYNILYEKSKWYGRTAMKTIKMPYYKSTMDLHIDEKISPLWLLRKSTNTKAMPMKKNWFTRHWPTYRHATTQRTCQGQRKVVLVRAITLARYPAKLRCRFAQRNSEWKSRCGYYDFNCTDYTAHDNRGTKGDVRWRNRKKRKNCRQRCFCWRRFVYVCALPSGAGFHVHKLAAQCDLLVTEGLLNRTFAGFSADAKAFCRVFVLRKP